MANSIAKLEKALRRDPDSPRFARLADRYLQRGRTTRALELCQKGCENFPDYATGFIVLSKCYEEQGALEEAREALSQALRLDPENPVGTSASPTCLNSSASRRWSCKACAKPRTSILSTPR